MAKLPQRQDHIARLRAAPPTDRAGQTRAAARILEYPHPGNSFLLFPQKGLWKSGDVVLRANGVAVRGLAQALRGEFFERIRRNMSESAPVRMCLDLGERNQRDVKQQRESP